MPTLILCLVILASGFTVILVGSHWLGRGAERSAPPAVVQAQAPQPTAPPVQPAAERLTREQLNQRLKDLQKSEPAIKDRPSAMCYRAAAPPQSVEFVCPKDGSRTKYPLAKPDDYSAARDAAGMRLALKGIKEMELSLDDSELCKKCSPAVKDPELILVVKVPGAPTEHRYRGLTTADVTLISEFLSGQTVHHASRDRDEPLKKHLDHIRDMLGLEAWEKAK